MKRFLIPLLSFGLLVHAQAGFVFQADYDIVGFGDRNEQVFSSEFALPSLVAIEFLEVELSHGYAAELILSLTSPTGEPFLILNGNGLRTRVGAGDGTLDGTEAYRFIAPGSGVPGVEDWNATRYQPGGTYGAGEWPVGAWDAGTWTLALLNNDISGIEDAVVGSVALSATVVPEPEAGVLLVFGVSVILFLRTHLKGRTSSCTGRLSLRSTRR